MIHLHVHSDRSLLDGLASPKKLVDRASELGQKALAITDHGTMAAWPALQKAAKAAGIKAICGCEVYVRLDAESNHRYHLTVLAQNTTGYRNLVRLQNLGAMAGHRHSFLKSELFQHSEGLIVLSGCLGSELSQTVLKDPDGANRIVEEYHSVFGDRYYLEIQCNQREDQGIVNRYIQGVASSKKIPIVATGDVHFCLASDFDNHDSLICLNTGTTKHDPDRIRYSGHEFLKSEAEMLNSDYGGLEHEVVVRAVQESSAIAARIEEIDLSYPRPPKALVEDDRYALREACKAGFDKLGLPSAYKARLKFEYSIVASKGFSSYFLILADLVAWAKEQGILTGPGRGSAAGSLVSYCLGITGIDPVKYGLLFERFMSPSRAAYPDIDLDIESKHRKTAIDYLKSKYGAENVCLIGTTNRLAAKAAIKDAGRILGYAVRDTSALTATIPVARGISAKIKDLSADPDSEFSKVAESIPGGEQLVNLAIALEGVAKSCGTHAAGAIVSPEPLFDLIPLRQDNDGQIVSEWNMREIEEFGLVKLDLLGLSTLDVIADTARMAGVPVPDLREPTDARAFDLICEGSLAGVFQLDSASARSFLSLQPRSIEDLSAICALNRPGPVDSGIAQMYVVGE